MIGLLAALAVAAQQPAAGVDPTGARMMAHIRILASDSFEGRGPGTRGDTLTVRYIRDELRRLGLKGAMPDGSYFQSVPMVAVRGAGTASFTRGRETHRLLVPDSAFFQVASGQRPVTLSSEVVFVGYGLMTPDRAWDDYKDVDVRGKVVVLLPGVPTAEAWRVSNGRVTPGLRARLAREHGAVAMVTIGTRAVMLANGGAPRTDVQGLDTTIVAPPLVQLVVAAPLIEAMLALGTTDSLTAQANRGDFRPTVVEGRLAIDYAPRVRRYVTNNVVALLPGRDPAARGETIVLSAHHDHLGRDTTRSGDQIYNGALDNAGGIAQFLEMARALTIGPRPRRSVLFLATAVEELGLLGAEWYVRHPIVPLRRTVGVVNLDFMTPWGRTRDVISVGDGMSTLDTLVANAAAGQGRVVTRDPYPEQTFYLRSDHYAFAKVGIPGLFVGSGMDYVDRPQGWGKRRSDQYLATEYHRPNDDLRDDWDLRGAAEDAALLVDVIRRLGDDRAWPTWSDKAQAAPFRAALETLRPRP